MDRGRAIHRIAATYVNLQQLKQQEQNQCKLKADTIPAWRWEAEGKPLLLRRS